MPLQKYSNRFIKIIFKTSDRDLMDRIINDNDVFSYAFVAKERLSVSITESSKPKFDKIKCTENCTTFHWMKSKA